MKSLNEFLARKENEYDELVRENERNRKTLRSCQLELDQIKENSDSCQKQ